MKYGYIYNTSKHCFTGQYNYQLDDQFYDGFFVKDQALFGFGLKGIHKFDLLLKQFKLWKTTPKGQLKGQESDSDQESNIDGTASDNKSERGMSDDSDTEF